MQAQGEFLAPCFFDGYFSEMNDALEFLREFKITDYGISYWDAAIAFAAILAGVAIVPRLAAFAKISSIGRARKVVSLAVIFLCSVFCLLIMLNAILNEDYTKVIGPVIVIIMQKNLVDRFYAFYDKAVDKMIDKTI